MSKFDENFIDYVKVFVKGGDGGNGAVAFLREKYRPKGGPAGGDGGKGGDVIFIATSKKHTLIDFKYKKHLIAENGEHGKGKNQHGKDGKDLIVYVPVGTVIKNLNGEIIADISEEGETVIVARGGRGGRGNARFASPTNQRPKIAEKGEEGEKKWLILELKLIADVGIVGLPNAGKSTLLKVLTRANPKIADYPFTTLNPNLGILEIDSTRRICIADIPGIIEEAHKGAGLGIKFLRHAERAKILIQLIDIAGYMFGIAPRPDEAFRIVDSELKEYSHQLWEKRRIIVGNKIDMIQNKEEIKVWRDYFENMGFNFIPISCITREGIEELKNALWNEIEYMNKSTKIIDKTAKDGQT